MEFYYSCLSCTAIRSLLDTPWDLMGLDVSLPHIADGRGRGGGA